MSDEHNNGMSEYVSRAEAARILRVHPRTIDRYGESGKLQRYARLGHVVYKREELEKLGEPIPWQPALAEDKTKKRDWL